MRGKEGSGVSEICLANRAQGLRDASCRAQGGQCDTSRGKASTRIQAPGQAAKKSLETRPQAGLRLPLSTSGTVSEIKAFARLECSQRARCPLSTGQRGR